jgi:hypothetical protein
LYVKAKDILHPLLLSAIACLNILTFDDYGLPGCIRQTVVTHRHRIPFCNPESLLDNFVGLSLDAKAALLANQIHQMRFETELFYDGWRSTSTRDGRCDAWQEAKVLCMRCHQNLGLEYEIRSEEPQVATTQSKEAWPEEHTGSSNLDTEVGIKAYQRDL